MRTIKEIVDNIDPNSEKFTDLEVRCVSIKKLYRELKQQGRIKDMNRIRLLFHYYPETMLEKVPVEVIKRCVDSPNEIRLNVSFERNWLFGYEKYAIEKFYGKESLRRDFFIKDVYEYFGI